MEKKLLSVREAAEIYGYRPEAIRNMCHAQGQRFAYQRMKGGSLKIDPKRFEKHLEKFYAWNGGRTR